MTLLFDNETETILRNKITDYASYLKSICYNEDKKELIFNKICQINTYELMLSMMFYKLRYDKDIYIKNLMNENFITYNEDNFNNIKNKIQYFLNVFDILNSKPLI